MATTRITAVLTAFAELGELERDYVLDELRLVEKSMQLRALEGMSQYEEQARELARLLDGSRTELASRTAELAQSQHELTEANYVIAELRKALGEADSEGGAVREATFAADGGLPPESEESGPVVDAPQPQTPATDAAQPPLSELEGLARLAALPDEAPETPGTDAEEVPDEPDDTEALERARAEAAQAFPDEDDGDEPGEPADEDYPDDEDEVPDEALDVTP